jgi:hypothetical protein
MTNSPHTRNQELQPAPEEHKRSSRLLILQEKAACSPRASVALSAFSAVTWLREVSSLIYRRIARGDQISTWLRHERYRPPADARGGCWQRSRTSTQRR